MGGIFGNRNIIKIVGVIVVCLAIVIVLRLVTDKKQSEEPVTEAATESVIETNNLEIPEITEVGEGTYSIEMNDGKALFTEDEIEYAKTTGFFIESSNLDTLSRPQMGWMNCDLEDKRSVDRDSELKDIKPVAWHVNGIYDKTHILSWELSNVDDIQNIITATEYLDKIEKAKYEKEIINYIEENPSTHVLYRVTPYYVDEELVARGLLLEAYSIEDEGKFELCVFVYNAQPGSEIDYATGAYQETESLSDALGISREELEELEGN